MPHCAAPLLAVLLATAAAAAHGRALAQESYPSGPSATPAPGLSPVERHVWRVTLGVGAPDCFERPVLLVNGAFQLPLEVTQGSTLEVRRAALDSSEACCCTCSPFSLASCFLGSAAAASSA